MPDADTSFLGLNQERFVQLTTFRKTGVPVSTPVWLGRDGDALIVTTPASSGKVKRLRNSPRVDLQACSRMGTVKDGSQVVSGAAEIIEDRAEIERLTSLMRKKYGLEYRVISGIERLASRGRTADRYFLRITPA